MGIKAWLFGEARQQPSTVVGEPSKRQSSRQLPRYKVIDVPGSWTRAVTGDDHFPDAVHSLPLGPVKVTLRLKPNDANPHAVAAFVGNRQVGWLGTEWTATDPWVEWMTRLDAARIRPRFAGVCRLHDILKYRLINFDVPGRNDEDLSAIADRLISEVGLQ